MDFSEDVHPHPGRRLRILDTADASLDVVGGIRYWRLKSELQFSQVCWALAWRPAAIGLMGSSAREQKVPPRKWWAPPMGISVLAVQTSPIRLLERGLSPRALRSRSWLLLSQSELRQNEFLFDTTMKGPLFGFTIKF